MASNVARMLAEQRAREAGRPVTDADLPSDAEVLRLIQGGKAG